MPGTNTQKRIDRSTVVAVPPTKPAILLFGLTLIKPLLFFPKDIPKTKAKMSLPKTSRKKSKNDCVG